MNPLLPSALSRLAVAAAVGGEATTSATVSRADLKILLQQHGQLVESARSGLNYYREMMKLQGLAGGTVIADNEQLESAFESWFSATTKALMPDAH